MSRQTRSRLVRMPAREEQEVYLVNNPLERFDSLGTPTRQRTFEYDYQAPLTSHSLLPNSKWLIVRRNLHRIRFMGYSESGKSTRLPDFYLGLQMTRELRRAQEEIKNADKEENFRIIKEFEMVLGKDRTKKFDTSHVKPEDALIYDRLGEEPLALQNLLYYFSKQNVQEGTVFWDFLAAVNQVLNLQRKRTVLVQRLRRIALILAVICYTIIGIMLLSMIISVIATTTRMNDPEVLWFEQNIDMYSSKDLSANSR